MGSVVEAIKQMMAAYGVTLPPWFGPVAMVLLVYFLWSMLQKNAGTDKARKLMRQLPDAPGPEKLRLQAEIFTLVGEQPDGLLTVAKTALEQGNRNLARDATEKLRATGKRTNDVRFLLRELDGEAPRMVEEAVVRIERALDLGLLPEAQRRLEDAQRRWPGDDALTELADRVAQAVPRAAEGTAELTQSEST